MITMLLLMLTAALGPTWFPTAKVDPAVRADFEQKMARFPEDSGLDQQDANCLWALHLIGHYERKPAAKRIVEEAKNYVRSRCGGPGGEARAAKVMKAGFAVAEKHGVKVPKARDAAPFPLPPLPDKAGNDLGAQLWVMFEALERRLASGGHRLVGEARACAWASAALAGAEAVQRTAGATAGIGAGVPVLQAQRASVCQGEALRAKEAAWAWLRANPGATQPLEVAQRPAASPWPSGPGDAALWVGAALLFSVAPEAAPALLLAQ